MMRPRIALPAVFFLFSLLSAPVCLAQVRSGMVEISPFAGYLFGGRFQRGTLAIFDADVDVDNHETYGARLGWNLTSKLELEAQVSRTETAFVTPGSRVLFGNSGRRLGDLTIDYLLGYGTFNFGRGRAVPYVTLGMGAARLDADVCKDIVTIPEKPCVNPDRDTRFTASVGTGVKIFATPHFGFRLDGRYYGTLLRGDRGSSCDHSRCDRNRNDWLSNGDVTGGLLFAF
jgi:opacity protein-like surface antigen